MAATNYTLTEAIKESCNLGNSLAQTDFKISNITLTFNIFNIMYTKYTMIEELSGQLISALEQGNSTSYPLLGAETNS